MKLIFNLRLDLWLSDPTVHPPFIKTLSDSFSTKRDNAGLQLRRAISIQAKWKRLLEKHATAPSNCKALLGGGIKTQLLFVPHSCPDNPVRQG